VLAPVQDDMLQLGRRSGPARPWLGMYTTETPDGLVVTGLAPDGPAERGGVHQGDVVADVAGSRPDSLADFYRKVWRRGPAGAVIPLTLLRAGDAVRVDVASTDRDDRLRKPRMQ
jgi:S1-C subfamily serine protease